MQVHDHHPPEPGQDPTSFESTDASGQSLADALRASFRILKFVMIIVVILYLSSGI